MHLTITHGDDTVLSLPLAAARGQRALRAMVASLAEPEDAAGQSRGLIRITLTHPAAGLAFEAVNAPSAEVAALVAGYYTRGAA